MTTSRDSAFRPAPAPVSASSRSNDTAPAGEARHLYFLDNLRIALTILVIAHHVGQAYGPTGGYWPIQEATRAPILGPFFTVNRSFFMSLFFMISGYLMVISYDHGGWRRFLRGRLLRLGVPLLFFFLLVIPVQQYLCHVKTGDLGPISFSQYYSGAYFGHGEPPAGWKGPAWPEMNFGHLWYVEHLLIFSLCYAVWRAVRRRPATARAPEARPLRHGTILLFALALAFTSAIVRRWHPIDRWIGFLGFIQVAFADVPRDLSFFVLGAIAYRRGWFLGLPRTMGRIWLAVGVTAAIAWYAYSLYLHRIVPIGRPAMAIVYPIWESLLCCGMCLGLLIFFRERLDIQSRWGRAMARSQYGAYLFHVPVIIAIQCAVASVAMAPFSKFLLVMALGVPLTFLLSDRLRRPAVLRRIL